MKVSETLSNIISRKQNGKSESVSRRKQVKTETNKEKVKTNSNGNLLVKEEKRDSISSTGSAPDSRRGRNSFSRTEVKRPEVRDSDDASPTRKHRSRLEYDKPWLVSPKLKRASKPEVKPAEAVNNENFSKKPPKPPSSQISPEKEKVDDRKAGETNFLLKNNSTEKRSKVTLKRQFALDKAPSVAPPPTNLRESPSEESLNSINSVTQLLKIERNTFSRNNNKTKQNGIDQDDDDNIICGVKQMAAKLEAKNANNLKNLNNENRRSLIDNDATNSKISSKFSGKKEEQSKEVKKSCPPTKAGIIINESSSVLLKAAAAVVCSLQTDRKKVSSVNTKIASSPSPTLTSSTLVNKSEAEVAAYPSKEEEKEKRSTLIVRRSSGANQDYERSSRSRSRTRSTSPQKPALVQRPKELTSSSSPERKCSFSIETNSSSRKSRSPTRRKSSVDTRSPSGSRKGSLGSGIFSATASSLAKQKPISNRVKDHREESTNPKKEWVSISNNSSNKSHLANSPNHTQFRGQGQRKNDVVEKNGISGGDQRYSNKLNNKNDENENETRRRSNSNTVPRYASPIRSSQTRLNSNPHSQSEKTKTQPLPSKHSERKNVHHTDWKFGIGLGSGKKCNSTSTTTTTTTSVVDTRNNNISNIKKSVKESAAPLSSSLSSSASSSSSSLPRTTTTSTRSRRGKFQSSKGNNSIVIPTIIMSEYVDGEKDGDGKMKKQSQSTIFTPPVEFTQPLQPSCDIVEGNSLELVARVRGAEYVVWVKDDKIVPNAPPDFEYFHEHSEPNPNSDTLHGLRIKDVFLEDAGIYSCEAYSRDAVITCWCEVDVLEAGGGGGGAVATNEEEEEEDDDISWDDMDTEEEVRSLVVPVIVTSQPEQEEAMTPPTENEPQEPAQHVQVEAKPIDNDKSECEETNAEETKEDGDIKSKDDNISKTFSDERGEEKRKLMSQLSSASDESIIYLKEPRSGDEGALSATEDASCLTVKESSGGSGDHENEDERRTESPDATVSSSSPCSEQNGRSSSVDSAIGMLGRPLFSDGKFPPRILVGPSNVIALYGEVVHLRVKVQNYGIPKTAVNWFKFINGTYKKIEHSSVGIESNTESQPHITITKVGTSLNTLTINGVTYDDPGRYRVKAQNALGMDSHEIILTVEGAPQAPSAPPKVKYDEKNKTILISWPSCPFDGGSKLLGYYVEASISKTALDSDQDNWQLLTPQSYSWLCYTLTEPKRGCVYRFRVFGENIYGKGKPTKPSLPLLVPVLMDGRRAGSSDALLWSLKSLSIEETSLRAESQRKNVVHEHEIETVNLEESVSSQEEEPMEYKNVTIKRGTFYDIYDKLDELGKGRFGVVFEVVNKETKRSYAGKFVKCIKAKDKERVQLEVNIMNDLAYHPKLICLIDAFEMPREIIIVTQRIDGGELFERVVADDFTLTEGDCITFLQQICDAVMYIHSKNIMHLDLKPENILCTSKNSNQIKIIDFGLAQYHNPKEPIRVLFGTAEFVSPEIINYEPIAPSTDNWSIGVITYILLSGLSPFMGDNDNETFSNITRAEFDFDDEAFEKISDDAKDFISNLIVKRPEKRMTAEECLNHRWLKHDVVNKTDVILPTDKLKRFLVRRKWQKTGNAIRALGRITTLYSSRRSSSASSTSTPSGSLSISSPLSPPPPSSITISPSRTSSLQTQDSLDNDNVFFSQPNSIDNSFSTKANSNIRNSAFNTSPNLNNKVNNVRPTSPSSNKTTPRSTTKNVQLLSHSHPRLSKTTTTTKTSKYSDPCRSDSGVCDVGSFSSLGYDS